ncbi:MAG: T9SS type A sorting domain-containing protein, partial [Candidatus Eisenbacteria bacterium]|nr:T9SS type A sorting domain-containing protein [Candidatus Eisenbacteria bacterium]
PDSTANGAVAGTCSSGSPVAVELGAPEWAVQPSEFQYNMGLVAVFEDHGTEWDAHDVIAAFVGDDCRGVARPAYVRGLDRNLAFLTVYSNAVGDETVAFKVFSVDKQLAFDVSTKIPFFPDGVRGTLRDPMVFNGVPAAGEFGIPVRFALRQNNPNPFATSTRIRFDLPFATDVDIRIFDVAGRLVRTVVDGRMEAGRHHFVWDLENDAGRRVDSGIYFTRMRADSFNGLRKMVVIR